MNQKDEKLGKSIFVYFDVTFLTTLTGIFDFANLISQKKFKLGKNSSWIFQTGELEKSSAEKIQELINVTILLFRSLEYMPTPFDRIFTHKLNT